MASSREHLDYILEQLSSVPGITYRPMMGEYLIYCKDKVIGGIYDDRFLLKPTPSALALSQEKIMEKPYEGGKEMLAAEHLEDKEYLAQLIGKICEELPAKGKRK